LILPFSAFAATFALVLVLVVDPYSGTYANAAPPSQWTASDVTQTLSASGDYDMDVSRDSYKVEVPVVEPEVAAAPATGTPDPGSAKAIAKDLLSDKGMGSSQYDCLVSLWNRESGWNVYASNPSGAYGIPQALPGSKMSSAGSNWATSAKTQIKWGLGYIIGRYQTPCGAWTHSQAKGWY
jgi:hypothetical protein